MIRSHTITDFPPFFMVLFFAFLFLFPSASSARDDDFTWCRFEMSVNHITGWKHLGNNWNDGPGIRAALNTPFLGLLAGGGIEYMTFTGSGPSIPDASGMFTYLRLGDEFQPMSKLMISGGLRMGMARMSFDKTERNLSAELRTEREAAAGADIGVAVPISRATSLMCSAQWTTLFTVRRIEFISVSAGLSHTVSMPAFLREFLE